MAKQPLRPQAAATRWPLALLVLVGLASAGVGVLMTWHHEAQLYGGMELRGELVGCAETEDVNCDVVNTSRYSEFLGVPIATWALPAYLTIAALALWGLRGERRVVGLLALAGLGTVAYSIFLYWVSKTQLQFVCAWCIRLYFANVAILALALAAGPFRAPRPSGRTIGTAAAIFAALAAVAILGQRGYRAMLLADAPTVATGAKGSGEGLDPEGPAPARSFEVRTEDGNAAVLRIAPDDPWKGNPDAAVTIVEFADFECGYCRRMSEELARVFEQYRDRVLFVFKHFPLDPACNPGVRNLRHKSACRTAAASVCAQAQRRFWAFHDLAFSNQDRLAPGDLRRYAARTGMDVRAYDQCMDGAQAIEAVRADGADGEAIDLHGTPRVWIEGRLYRAGTSAEQIARVVERAIAAAATP